MADFDLIQTDAQVQSILNDGQNMQGAGAQTTLTTESVLLKDVNGNYHKILKSSFTEAIRDTLAGLLVNNDKGTTINQIAAIANGDFGSIAPANLASVLGGLMIIGTDERIDANDARLRQVGFHIFGVNTQTNGTEYNYPPSSADDTGNLAQCTLVSIFTSNSYGYQIFHRRKSTNFFIRSYENSVWQPWTKIPGATI